MQPHVGHMLVVGLANKISEWATNSHSHSWRRGRQSITAPQGQRPWTMPAAYRCVGKAPKAHSARCWSRCQRPQGPALRGTRRCLDGDVRLLLFGAMLAVELKAQRASGGRMDCGGGVVASGVVGAARATHPRGPRALRGSRAPRDVVVVLWRGSARHGARPQVSVEVGYVVAHAEGG